MQTYAEYLETMKSYRFSPSSLEGWKNWQLHLHGCYKDENGNLIDEYGSVVPESIKDGFGRTKWQYAMMPKYNQFWKHLAALPA